MEVIAQMPPDWRYREVFLHGRPRHDQDDRFSIKHPNMPPGHRAIIFAPFAALRGFSEAVSAKETGYVKRRELGGDDLRELNRQLDILHNLTYTGRMARENRVIVTVTYFVPCQDVNHDAFGVAGQYETLTGVCWNVDPDISRTIRVGNSVIAFENISKIESKGDYFSAFDPVESIF